MHPFYNPNDQWCLSQNLNSQKMQPFDMDNTTGRSLLESRLSDRHKTKTIVLRLGPTIRDNNRLLYQCRTIKTSCRKGEFRPKITIKVCAQLFNSINEYSLSRITIIISDDEFCECQSIYMCGVAKACLPTNSLCLRIIWRSYNIFV